jgi:hypothetical protein
MLAAIYRLLDIDGKLKKIKGSELSEPSAVLFLCEL